MADFISDSALRLRRIFGNRALLLGALLAVAAGTLLTGLPLFRQPGFELASAMAIIVTLACGPAAIAVARREQREAKGIRPHLIAPFLASVSYGIVALGIPFAVAAIRTLTTSPCSPWKGALFYLLIPLPSAFIAAAAGLACGFLFKRSIVSYAVYGLLLLASLAVTLLPIYFGPQVFALNHFFGYFPGPLYDEALSIDLRLIAYRTITLAWTVLILSGLAGLFEWRLHRRFDSQTATFFVGAFLLLLAGLVFRYDLGLTASDASVAQALGGMRRTSHFDLHFPKGLTPEEVGRLERDLEADYASMTAFLGVEPTESIQVFLYRTPREKQRLVGAASTSFAKPWRNVLHIQQAPFPHPVARHELVHVLAGSFGSPIFHVSAHHLLGINMGLVEGLAVAADNPGEELTLDEQVAGMRRLGLAPDLREIVGVSGFYGQSPERAYTAAGSFLRYIALKHGPEAVRKLYPRGDFQGATGETLGELVSGWEAHLDALPLDSRALRIAEIKFRRKNLFERPCAREVASLAEEAEGLTKLDPERAIQLFDRCAALEPGNGNWVDASSELLLSEGLPEEARIRWQHLLDESTPVGLRALIMMSLGDLSWFEGDLDQARLQYDAAAAIGRDRAFDRTVGIKRLALSSPVLEPAIRAFFENNAAMPETLALEPLTHLTEPLAPSSASGAVDQTRPCAVAGYMIGRQLLTRDAPRAALVYLERARKCDPIFFGTPLKLDPHEFVRQDDFKLETYRLIVRAAFLANEPELFANACAELKKLGSPADQLFADKWLERGAFETKTYGGWLRSRR